jgi:hypothetical protein
MTSFRQALMLFLPTIPESVTRVYVPDYETLIMLIIFYKTFASSLGQVNSFQVPNTTAWTNNMASKLVQDLIPTVNAESVLPKLCKT